ncbi:MAG: hypothetical protein Fur0039_12910 [Rhodocyclaceae bacterium]
MTSGAGAAALAFVLPMAAAPLRSPVEGFDAAEAPAAGLRATFSFAMDALESAIG